MPQRGAVGVVLPCRVPLGTQTARKEVNNVIKHQVERAGFRGSLNLTSDLVLNTKAVHLGECSTPQWSELEPHVARARAGGVAWASQSRGILKNSRAAPHQSRTLPLCAQCPSCMMQTSSLPSTSALPNPQNALKVPRALTPHQSRDSTDSIVLRFSG